MAMGTPAQEISEATSQVEGWPLEMPLLRFSERDVWTLRDACTGTVCFGGSGAGKTSAAGRALATNFLRAGFGALVLCAKPGEANLWRRYCEETGRLDSLIVFDESGRQRFNFLEYELKRGGRLITQNLVNLFLRVIEATQGGQHGEKNPFWRNAVSELLNNAFLALYSAYGQVRLDKLMELLDTAPVSPEQAASPSWQEASFCWQTVDRLREGAAVPISSHDAHHAASYLCKRFAGLDKDTRTNVMATLTSMIHPFLSGYLRELFCTSTTVLPEMTHHGAVIVVDLPVKEHAEAGILAQHVWKYLFQRAAERRKETADHRTRPVVLWADECQFFLSDYDAEFQSTARESKACTVYLTQNLPTVYARLGERSEHQAKALLGNFQSKLFFANDCPDTNAWAAEIIGKVWQWVESHGASEGISENWGESWQRGGSQGPGGGGGSNWGQGGNWGRGRNSSVTQSRSRQLQHELLPSAFMRLAKADGQRWPEAIVMQGGRLWQESGTVWLRCIFPQA
jgi:hypothetical protein